MSEKIVLETLKGIGLTEKDAEVYIQLAKRGTIIARDLTKPGKINKAQVYRSLKNLQSKGIVEASIETPQNFTAMPFERVYDLYVGIKNEEAKKLKQNREVALQRWQEMAIQQAPQLSDRFMVIEGKNFIYTRIQEMVKKAQTQVLVATDSNSLMQADLDNALDKFVQQNRNVTIRVVSEITVSNSQKIAELFEQFALNVRARHVDLEEKAFPRFVLIDDREIMFLTAALESRKELNVDVGFWTNNKSLIQSFQVLFDQLWHTGVEFQEKLQQILNGKPLTTSRIIKDSQEAEQTLAACFREAKKEAIIITTEDDLPLLELKKDVFAEASSRSVNILILAPITEKNSSSAVELSKIAKLKHIPTSYFRAIVIDGVHLFQLKATPPSATHRMPPDYFGSTFYTNDPEYVLGRRDLLLNMWNQTPTEIDQLKHNEARLRSMYDNSEDAIILATPSGEVITANKAACTLFGMTVEEMKSANRQNMVIADQKIHQAIQNRETTGKSKAELTFRRKDGTTFQGETTVSNFTDTDGKTKDCIIIRDTTKRKQDEDSLVEREQRFQTMFNAIDLGISIVDAQGKVTHSNPAFQAIMGYTQQELQTKTFLELTHPEDRHIMKRIYQELLEGKTSQLTVEKRNVRKDDQIVRVKLNINVLCRDNQGKPLEFFTTIEDTTANTQSTEIKNLKETLKVCEERFGAILDNSVDFVYRHNLQTGHYEFASPSVKRILGYEAKEIIEMSNEEVLTTVHPDDLPQLQGDLIRIIREGKGYSEYRVKKKDGSYIWYRNNMTITYDAAGRPLYRDGIAEDITEIKQAQTIINKQKTMQSDEAKKAPIQPTKK
jgi:PAS domain S-box-containing protein